MAMRIPNIFGIRFIIRTGRAREGKSSIYLKITVNNRAVEISLKRKIAIDQWNTSCGMAKGNKIESRQLNIYLERVRSSVVESQKEMQLRQRMDHR